MAVLACIDGKIMFPTAKRVTLVIPSIFIKKSPKFQWNQINGIPISLSDNFGLQQTG